MISDQELRAALHRLAPDVEEHGVWEALHSRGGRKPTRVPLFASGERVFAGNAKPARPRRASRTRRFIGFAAVTAIVLVAVVFGANALVERMTEDHSVVVITDDTMGPSSTAGSGEAAASSPIAELAQAWRDMFLEGLWAGNVDTIPEHPAGLSSDFWVEPENPLELPMSLASSFEETKPLWIFADELDPEEVLSAFRTESGRRPVLVLTPPQELLDSLGLTVIEEEKAGVSSGEQSSTGQSVLMRLPETRWDVLRVQPSRSRPAASAGREAYEALARATMIELRSFAGGSLLNADGDDDAQGFSEDHEGAVLYTETWGDSLGQFQAPPLNQDAQDLRGSYAMAAGPKESLFVLDPVSKKVQVLSKTGEPVAEIDLTAEAPEDLAVTLDATVFVNDRQGTGEIQAYGLGSGLLDSIPASGDGLEVVGLVGVSTGGYGVASAEVRSTDGSTFFSEIYRFQASPPSVSGKLIPGEGGEGGPTSEAFKLKSAFLETQRREDLAPLGQAWWGRVWHAEDGFRLEVSGPRGPFDVPLAPEEGFLLVQTDVLTLVESLNGDARDCRVMVSGVVRDRQDGLRRAVWLFDNHGELLEQFVIKDFIVWNAESPTEGFQDVAACGSFEGFLYVLRVGDDGVRILRYGVD